MAKDKPEENGEEILEDAHPTCDIDPENGGGADGAPEQEADIDPDSLFQDQDLEQQLQEMTEKAEERRHALLSAMAEMDNLRKRTAREMEAARKYAVEGFAKELLAVADNLDRALAHAEEGEDASGEGVIEGVKMIKSELFKVFVNNGITRIDPDGEPFDHNFHQAMMQVENGEVDAGTVVQVMQVGYQLNGRLLRPAMVGVSKKPA